MIPPDPNHIPDTTLEAMLAAKLQIADCFARGDWKGYDDAYKTFTAICYGTARELVRELRARRKADAQA